MRIFTKREVNIHTAKVLGLIAPGEPAIITERGVPRWKIESIDAGTTMINGLHVTPPRQEVDWRKFPRSQGNEESSESILSELREDRI